uniref:Mitochondrial assembly of ribosomal large subunit protein 1 n=1 Tax=Zosterops lateralis melanops TaxID=1220523 RepID=A0A8D2PKN0_ZOSLA
MWLPGKCLASVAAVPGGAVAAANSQDVLGYNSVNCYFMALNGLLLQLKRKSATVLFFPCAPDTVLPKFNIDLVVALLRQENAKDICVIQLSPEIKYCDYFIIVSGFSTRHLHAMANYMLKMYKHLKEDGSPRTQIEGKETDDWLCIDFGHIVVHFMLPETREVYELEKLWTLGPYDDQLAQMTPQPLPKDFIFGLTPNSSDHLETRT